MAISSFIESLYPQPHLEFQTLALHIQVQPSGKMYTFYPKLCLRFTNLLHLHCHCLHSTNLSYKFCISTISLRSNTISTFQPVLFFSETQRWPCNFTASKCSKALNYQENKLHTITSNSAGNILQSVLIKPQEAEYIGWQSQGYTLRHDFSHLLLNSYKPSCFLPSLSFLQPFPSYAHIKVVYQKEYWPEIRRPGC